MPSGASASPVRLFKDLHMCSNHGSTPAEVASVSVPDSGMAATRARGSLIDDLVTANRILFKQGIVDAFGHVSARLDTRSDRFLLARNMAPGRVKTDDIVEFDLDGAPVNANGRKVYLERFIHSEIYREHPEVMAVVHSHSAAIVPLSVSKSFPLKPLFHMAGFIGRGAPVFEIRDAGGTATDLLISNARLGKALAAMFSDSKIVLMRGHGSTVVAHDLRTVVYRAIYAEVNARFQLAAGLHGEVVYLTPEEAEACVLSIEGQIDRPWDLWKEMAAD